MVWLTLKVVATSTVAAAVPRLPPVAKLEIAIAVKRLLDALVKVLPVATVRPALKVARPVTVRVPLAVTPAVVVLTLKTETPVAFWISKAVVELAVFLENTAPVLETLNAIFESVLETGTELERIFIG